MTEKTIMPYLFFLGRSRELATAELLSFFPQAKRVTDDIYQVDEESFNVNGKAIATRDAMSLLGGTVKIAVVLGIESSCDSKNIIKYISHHSRNEINNSHPGLDPGSYKMPDQVRHDTRVYDDHNKITFGISTYEGVGKIPQSVYQDIKQLLENNGKKVRFVLPQDGSVLSSVAVVKQGVTEINIVKIDDGFLLSKTLAVQEFEEWGRRDFDRPFFDSKKGMLPPKAARMAVNIALSGNTAGKTVLDPFCGMGTIPGEAVLLGAIAMGSDTSKEAIEKAKKNTIWLRSRDANLPPVTYFVSDATHISQYVREGTIDAIVTEPFMGSPKLGLGKMTDAKEIRNAVKGLEKLYIGCLREWLSLLKKGGVVVIALPEIELGKTKYFVKSVIDSCEALGYTNQLGPLPYSRPQAVVRRMFYKFKKL